MQIIRRRVPQALDTLLDAGIDHVLARIYAARGVRNASELDHALAGLPSWTTLKGIDAAAARLANAVQAGERILIVADYDADGATACAVAMRGLGAMGARADFLVPNRFEFGYGLTPEIVGLAAARKPDLIITVDNGIASIEGVAAAHRFGIDVLITDHHLPGSELPSPAWIVNPNQGGCMFPSKHLAGVGVMFYVLTAARAVLRERGYFANREEPHLAGLLDLVALGTVADVVRLDHPNRILVDQGLKRIRAGRMQPGLRALFAAAGRDPARASAYDLGFVAGPRLNAAGRLADMSIGIACLLAEDQGTAAALATQLDRLNHERRDVEATIHEEALRALADEAADGAGTDAHTLCLYRADWHQGVVGIIASRLKDRFHRPTIVLARAQDGSLRGSGRSIPGFHLRDALDLVTKRAPDVITRFGGHAFAAGLSLREHSLPRFIDEFERVGREKLSPDMLNQTLETDGELAPEELNLGLARTLEAQVWGQGFPAPLFDDQFDVTEQRRVGSDHVRLVLARGGKRFDGIAFNETPRLPAQVRAVYRPELDRYQSLEGLQLILCHWAPSEGSNP